MEVPCLGVSSIGCLDDHVSVVDQVKIFVAWQFRNNVEVSFDIESELLVEFSFAWFSLPFISVDNIPFLCDSVIWFLIGSNVLVLNILVVEDR
jgi:hypothetical protein